MAEDATQKARKADGLPLPPDPPVWYAIRVTTNPLQKIAIVAAVSLMAGSIVRWRLRRLLGLLPGRPPSGRAGARGLSGPGFRIGYLFAGSYGDFVQILRPLNRLAAAHPGAEIILYGGERYFREFQSELPPELRPARPFEPWLWIRRPLDLLLTNCVGVYRVRFDLAGRFCAREAYGFRHSHETGRGGYAGTLPLDPAVRNFAEENLRLLDLAGIASNGNGSADFTLLGPVPNWGRGKILFMIGSAGLKKDFGLKTYTRLVFGILERLDGLPVEVVMGPGDEDIALEVRTGTSFNPQMFPLSRLIRILRSFEGTVLCFNSFPAHICHYLGRSAVVLHRETVPFGYDCAPLHRQVVLKSEMDWDLGEVWEALELNRS